MSVSMEGSVRDRWRSSLIGRMVLLGGGTAMGQGVVLLATPAITRLYSPEQMGLFGLLTTFLGLWAVVSNLRFDQAILSAGRMEEGAQLLVVALVSSIGVALFSAAVFLGMVYWNFLGYARLPLWTASLAGAGILLIGAFTALRSWAARAGNIAPVTRGLIAQGIGRATIPILAAPFGLGWLGLALGEVCGRLFGVGTLARSARTAFERARATLTRPALQELLRKYAKFPAIALPSAFLDALTTALPIPLIASAFGEATAGHYLLVITVSGAPAALIANSLADVLHVRLSELHEASPRAARMLFRASLRRLTLVSLAIYGPFALLAPLVFGPLFGEAWTRAGLFFAVLVPLQISGLVASPAGRVLSVVNRPEQKLFLDLIRVFAPIVAFALLPRVGAADWVCMAVFSAALTLAYILTCVRAMRVVGLPAAESWLTLTSSRGLP